MDSNNGRSDIEVGDWTVEVLLLAEKSNGDEMCLRNIVVSALGWTYLGVTLLRGGGISFDCETCIFVTCLSVFFSRKVSSCLLELKCYSFSSNIL